MSIRKFSVLSIILFALVLIVSIGAFTWYNNGIAAPSTNSEPKRVVITRGASTEKIANTLKEAGVIKDAFIFRLYTQLNNQSRNIPAGQFDIPQNLSVTEVIAELKKGPTQIWVTIPEGLRREEIPAKFVEALGLTGNEADNFTDQFLAESKDMEGYLFPDTYLFPPEVTATTAVETMRNTFDVVFSQSERAKLSALGLSLDEAVILASLIERETKDDDESERPTVAGILLNRLELGMPLQIDATVQYAVGKPGNWWTSTLTRDQIENTNSPYNTYLNPGIPPAPIANPGKSALLAVANPKSSNYLYYIHADGQIYYAEDLQGHNANIDRYLR